VSVWLRDAAGNQSGPFSDTIVLDTARPTQGAVTASPGDGAVALAWSGFADAGSGVAAYRLAQAASATPPSTCNAPAWTGAASGLSISGLTNGTTYSWRLCAVDGAGNASSGVTLSARPAPEFVAPTGTVLVNGGAALTSSRAVTLSLSASDASGVTHACVSNTTRCTAWFPYATTRAWSLGTSNGVATVYASFRDAYGNASAPVSDTIAIDSTRPRDGILTATPSSGTVALSWSGFSDAGGLTRYLLMEAEGATAPSSCAGSPVWSGSGTSATRTGRTNGATYAYRLCAEDAAGNLSRGAVASARPAPEYVPPTGSLTLAGGAAWTRTAAVTAAVSGADASGVAAMCLSNSTTCSSWVPYASAATWTLASGSGAKTVRLWLRDAYGNVSEAVTDEIGLDLTAPTKGALALTVGSGSATLSWTGVSDAHSGVARHDVYQALGTQAPACSGTPVATTAGSWVGVSGLEDGSTYTWRMCAVDAVGNASAGAVVSGRPAPEFTPPTGTVSVDGGAAWTSRTAVTLSLAATDPSGVAAMCASTSTSCSAWVPYASALPFTLRSGSGTKTVSVWFRDAWGNTSAAPATDTIGLDTTPPTNPVLSATAASGGGAVSWTAATDAHVGLSHYVVVVRAGGSPGTRCTSGTVAYSGTGRAATLTGLQAGVAHGVRVCAVDALGNVGGGGRATITPL
jgi:hypothetical protein